MAGDTVYAVASGKGGVGKTTTTVNLGTALAAAGHRTVLVDCDLAMANLARFVSLGTDDATLHEVLAGEASVEDATYRLADGIAAVPSAADLEHYSDVVTENLETVVDRLREAFEYVLLDVGAGVGRETVLPLGLADGTFVVVTPEPAAVRDADKTVGLVERAGGTVEGVVVTRVRDDDESAPAAIADRMGQRLVATVPEDEAVRESVRAGRPVVIDAAESPAAEAYRRLAAWVVEGDRDGTDTDTRGDGGHGSEDPGGASQDRQPRYGSQTGSDGDDDADDSRPASEEENHGRQDGDPSSDEATGASHSDISDAIADVEDDDG